MADDAVRKLRREMQKTSAVEMGGWAIERPVEMRRGRARPA